MLRVKLRNVCNVCNVRGARNEKLPIESIDLLRAEDNVCNVCNVRGARNEKVPIESTDLLRAEESALVELRGERRDEVESDRAACD